MQKSKIKVTIDGIEYTITGRESEEYLKHIASYVDKKLQQTKVQCNSLNSTLIAVLTAVTIADDYLKEKKLNQALEKQINEFSVYRGGVTQSRNNNIKPLNINL